MILMTNNIPTGKKQWIIADGYLPKKSHGDFVSHEAVCVLNLNQQKAKIEITIYFEDREPIKNIRAECPPERTNHIRLDKIKNQNNEKIPRGVPYAIKLESDQPIIAQHSRMDTSQQELSLMTTVPY